MLFDLRSRGRRRSVKVIYSGLAVLMGLALVFLGVGGLGGNVLEGISKESRSGSNSYAAKVTAARKQIAKNPSDTAAWIALTEAQLHEATGGEYYSSAKEAYTEKGKQQLRKAANSWNRYLSLSPKPPSLRLAKEVANIFATTALNEPANAVQALQIIIAAEPESAALYSQLAQYAYLAHNEREGDLATKKAVELAPNARRALLESELERVKRSVKEEEARAKAGAGGAAATGGTAPTTSTTSTSSSAAGKKK
jgi:predicted Zn-dependent protease